MRGGQREEEWRERFRAVRAPLLELERYLESTEITRAGRKEQLLKHRERLRDQLSSLETEARQFGVPVTWRE